VTADGFVSRVSDSEIAVDMLLRGGPVKGLRVWARLRFVVLWVAQQGFH